MNFSGTHEVALDKETLWTSLHDAEILERSIPGCENLERIEGQEDAFRATVATRVGPIKAKFAGEVTVEDTNPPDAYRLHGSGKAGAAGAAKGDVDVELTALDESRTELKYTASIAVTGRMAQIGAKMLKGTAEAFANEFFTNLAANVVGSGTEDSGDRETTASEDKAFTVPRPALLSPHLLLYAVGIVVLAAVIYMVVR